MNKGKICVSVGAETADETIAQIKRAQDSADVIEIRFDCIEPEQTFKTSAYLASEKPLLLTYRPQEQGGKAVNDLDNRQAWWTELVINNEMVETRNLWFDYEYDLTNLRKVSNQMIIRSFHDFSGVPKNLPEIFESLSVESEIAKIAVKADDITDTIAVWNLLEKAKAENKPIIPIAMGEAGKWTRILGLAHGALMTYAALESGKETAPGQVSAQDLIEVYRVKELNEETEVYGILGGNTSVSLSPYIHNEAFKFHNLNAVFVPLQTKDLNGFMRRMVKPETREVELNFKGFAVTIPHKQSIIKHLDFIDETARKIGAVNTVKIIDGKLHGYNTDAHGFIEPLKTCYGDLTAVKVAVLGAGGAARACLYALQKEDANVTIFARDLSKSQKLVEDFQVELKELPTAKTQKPKTDFKDFDILVNTTPLGMRGEAEGETPAVAAQLAGLQLVYDLVYVPFKTRLLAEADLAEVPKIGGLAMLIAQAMEQQKIWTGRDAPMLEMSRAALKRLR
ncbi:MAG: shikimate dehydrogenase [Pyrinomonadaceae bacterium]|nr:shikimate dehydrogenase [Pyrinomonadaceae bacterium]